MLVAEEHAHGKPDAGTVGTSWHGLESPWTVYHKCLMPFQSTWQRKTMKEAHERKAQCDEPLQHLTLTASWLRASIRKLKVFEQTSVRKLKVFDQIRLWTLRVLHYITQTERTHWLDNAYVRTYVRTYVRNYVLSTYVDAPGTPSTPGTTGTPGTYVRTHSHTYVRMHALTHLRTHIRTYVHTYVRRYVRTHLRTYIRTYVHTWTLTNLHTYAHTYTMWQCVVQGHVFYWERSGNAIVDCSFIYII